MRQVPRYVIVGNGCVAKHFIHYFNQLDIHYFHWCRAKQTIEALYKGLVKATHVLLLITDSAIEGFVKQYLAKRSHLIIIHFSGSLCSELAYGAHPLQTFSCDNTFTGEAYSRVPFVLEKEGPTFETLFPDLKNPHYYINKALKPYYHAMCMLANNFSALFWQKFYREMTSRFAFQEKDIEPFLMQTFENIKNNPQTALTGPLVRKDKETLVRDLKSLENDAFHAVFKAVIEQF